jgi:O-antigen/teichoic acid export membrane protein
MTQAATGGNERQQAGKAALNAFAIRVASAGIAYITQVLLARWMGSFDYGVFVLVWVCVLILGGLSSLGLNFVLMRFIPEYEERKELSLLRGLLLQSRLVTFAVSTAVALIGLLSLKFFGHLVEAHYLWPLALGLCCLPAYTLTDMQDGVGRAKSWINLALIPPYVLRPLLILACMAIARAAGLPLAATTAVGCAIIATWASGLLQLIVIQMRLRTVAPPGPRSYASGEWFSTALPIWFISACELVFQNTDVLVLSRFQTADSIGIYFAALKTISLIAFVSYAVGSALASRLATLKARGDEAALKAAIQDAANWTFWPSLLGAAFLLLFGKTLLGFFGAEFESGYPVMFVLVIGILLRAAVGPAEFVLRTLGAQNECAYVLGGTAVLNIVLNLVLVPTAGILGAAAATSISMGAAGLLFLVVARIKLGLNIGVWSAVR